MDYSIRYQGDRGFFEIKTRGPFSIDVFKSLASALLAHERWAPGTDCLFDYRDTDFTDVPTADFHEASLLHQVNNETIGKGRSALVMKPLGNFGLGRMYQGMTEIDVDTAFYVFTEYDDALAWLRS